MALVFVVCLNLFFRYLKGNKDKLYVCCSDDDDDNNIINVRVTFAVYIRKATE